MSERTLGVFADGEVRRLGDAMGLARAAVRQRTVGRTASATSRTVSRAAS